MQLLHAPAQYQPEQTVQFIGGEGTIVKRRFSAGMWLYTICLPRNQNGPADKTVAVELMESDLLPQSFNVLSNGSGT